jgi:conjugal transfer/entry exclusion protein
VKAESFQVEHTESLNMTRNIITALRCCRSTVAENSQRITDKLSAFTAARDTHAASMQELKEIDTAIERCKQERQTALSESAEAEQDWRSRFRTLRGNLTPEMKAEHSKRIASRELADEFTGLIAELETDRTRAMLNACSTGSKYRQRMMMPLPLMPVRNGLRRSMRSPSRSSALSCCAFVPSK